MSSVLFNNLTSKEKSEAIEHLIENSSPRADFFLMVVLSIVMATLGVLIDNTAVVIGSMLIAPMLYSVLSFSLALVLLDWKLFGRSCWSIVKSVFFSLLAAVVVTFLFAPHTGSPSQNFEVISRIQPDVVWFAVAFVAGLAGSFALTKPHLGETLPGVAISVSLIPPLAVSGVGFALFDWEIMIKSFQLFLINAAGIALASFAVFFLMKFQVERRAAKQAVKKEQKLIEKEK